MEQLDEELMVFDQESNEAHCLSAPVATVWQLADGTNSIGGIAEASRLPERQVVESLAELERCGLLERTGVTRRAFALKAGGAIAAAPLVYSLAIGPAAAMASTVQCATNPCSGVANPAAPNQANNAQTQANRVCSGKPAGVPAPGCQSTSQCIGAYNPVTFTYTGVCQF